jgi:hypothetical protein
MNVTGCMLRTYETFFVPFATLVHCVWVEGSATLPCATYTTKRERQKRAGLFYGKMRKYPPSFRKKTAW